MSCRHGTQIYIGAEARKLKNQVDVRTNKTL
jgi:hypothetical protein